VCEKQNRGVRAQQMHLSRVIYILVDENEMDEFAILFKGNEKIFDYCQL